MVGRPAPEGYTLPGNGFQSGIFWRESVSAMRWSGADVGVIVMQKGLEPYRQGDKILSGAAAFA